MSLDQLLFDDDVAHECLEHLSRHTHVALQQLPKHKPLEPPPVSPARGPPTDWPKSLRSTFDRAIFPASPAELPVIDIHSL